MVMCLINDSKPFIFWVVCLGPMLMQVPAISQFHGNKTKPDSGMLFQATKFPHNKGNRSCRRSQLLVHQVIILASDGWEYLICIFPYVFRFHLAPCEKGTVFCSKARLHLSTVVRIRTVSHRYMCLSTWSPAGGDVEGCKNIRR